MMVIISTECMTYVGSLYRINRVSFESFLRYYHLSFICMTSVLCLSSQLGFLGDLECTFMEKHLSLYHFDLLV